MITWSLVLNDIYQTFGNWRIVLFNLLLVDGFLVLLVFLGELLSQNRTQLKITKVEIFVLFFFRVVFWLIPNVFFLTLALNHVGMIKLEAVLVFSSGLKNFNFVFKISEMVFIVLEDIFSKESLGIVNFSWGLNELGIYAVELRNGLVFF